MAVEGPSPEVTGLLSRMHTEKLKGRKNRIDLFDITSPLVLFDFVDIKNYRKYVKYNLALCYF
jgi:hypothetical protein